MTMVPLHYSLLLYLGVTSSDHDLFIEHVTVTLSLRGKKEAAFLHGHCDVLGSTHGSIQVDLVLW